MKRTILTILAIAAFGGAMAQQPADEVLFDMNGKHYYKAPFMKEFLRSVGKDPAAAPTACTYEKRKALEEYVQLYVNFQAKLTDAYDLGFDTLPSLNKELASYRKELAAPYLIDSVTLQSLLHEAYERNHYVLHAAHILVPCAETDLPADTLKAYSHAMDLYGQIMSGTDFFTVSKNERRSQMLASRDPEVRAKADQLGPAEGDLGCFTVFDMIYPFETAAYALQPGQVSMPVRSRYGYHIIKLFERHEHYGKLQMAHIWIPDTDPKAEGKIHQAYNQIKAGEDFAKVAKNYSADRNTSRVGGLMAEMTPNQLPSEYIGAVASGMPEGAVSKPFQTRFGWHIVSLIKKESIPPFESMVPYYKSRMSRGERSTRPQHIFAEQCKSRYDFVDYTKVRVSKKKNAPYAASLAAVRALLTDSIFSAIFNYDSNQITDMRPLFKIGDRQFDSRQLAQYIYQTKKVRARCDLDVFVQNRYDEYVEAMLVKYADDHLERDNAEFAALMDEYRHGLMIFAYNDKMVWSRAIKDSLGFEDFYKQASAAKDYNDTNDAPYFWNDRARVHVYTILDSAQLESDKALKMVRKAQKKGWDSTRLMDAFAAKVREGRTYIAEEVRLVEKDHQQLLSASEWRLGTYVHAIDSATKVANLPAGKDGYQLLVVEQLLQPELKSCQEARGYYLSDYQNYLEAENVKRLREKYNVVIRQDVVDEITY